jgi:hypothetical protein
LSSFNKISDALADTPGFQLLPVHERRARKKTGKDFESSIDEEVKL